MAQEVHCFVDSTYSSETAGWAVTHFQTLSNAWSAVADAGEIDVAAGVYSAPTMVVDKTVAIRGSGSGQTFLQSSEEVTPLGWWQIAAGEVLTLEGCTLDVQTNTSFAVAIKAIGLLNMEYCSLALPVDCKAVETFSVSESRV